MVTITSFWSSRVIDWGAAAARFVLQSSNAKARALIRLHMGQTSRFLVGRFWRVRPGRSGEVPRGELAGSTQLSARVGEAPPLASDQLSSRLASAKRRPLPRTAG